ncbi:cyclase family protein [Alicyclobacillus fastidiosus]|uniref:Cyclase family protein n=1 Tax=Alicyclobacillus fastidiosus TaxID=392011 RepID=A0ABY6ZCK7_9BACL|nr:cyclase family protein [Alicyclobacillus fastidiosus]WAH39851.1 cyclase family protein [Alicyclobacillus fastidiosus]GMA61109.1 cyclase [Alicyclobacillus fastidiosus]
MKNPVHTISELLTESFEIIDLSHTLVENIPAWPTHSRFGHTLYESYESGDIASHYQLVMSEHTGTHMDAPLHFIREGKAHYGVDKVNLQQVFGKAVVIDATDVPPNGTLSYQKINEWEEKNGTLLGGEIVLIRYGWDKRWDIRPRGNEFLKDWPGLGKDAAEYLVSKEVKAVGCDTLAIDSYVASDNPAHYELLGNEVLIIENLNNLQKLPKYSLFFAFPLKIGSGSGSPVRAVAFVPRIEV